MARKTKMAKWFERRDAILAHAKTVGFQTFAMMWIAFLTSHKAEDGYTVEQRGDLWALRYGGADSVVGDAQTVYGWVERSPLRRLALEAEELRQEAFA